MAASDRTRKLAEEIAGMACCLPAGDIQPLLDAFEREAKLEIWNQVAANYCQCEELGGQCWIHYNIAALAAQPTPEVKK